MSTLSVLASIGNGRLVRSMIAASARSKGMWNVQCFLSTVPSSLWTYLVGLIKESVLVLDETYFSEDTKPWRSNMGARDVRT